MCIVVAAETLIRADVITARREIGVCKHPASFRRRTADCGGAEAFGATANCQFASGQELLCTRDDASSRALRLEATTSASKRFVRGCGGVGRDAPNVGASRIRRVERLRNNIGKVKQRVGSLDASVEFHKSGLLNRDHIGVSVLVDVHDAKIGRDLVGWAKVAHLYVGSIEIVKALAVLRHCFGDSDLVACILHVGVCKADGDVV